MVGEIGDVFGVGDVIVLLEKLDEVLVIFEDVFSGLGFEFWY